jgi:hypothetical protein
MYPGFDMIQVFDPFNDSRFTRPFHPFEHHKIVIQISFHHIPFKNQSYTAFVGEIYITANSYRNFQISSITV